jgi:hypothetical protein
MNEWQLEQLKRDAARYNYVRTMNPREFSALWETNLRGGHRFDELVDARIKERENAWNTQKPFGAS